MSNVGRVWPSEMTVCPDARTGATVYQLTDFYATSRHGYFTNPCWYDEGRKLVILSQRDNAMNLYSIDLASGDLTQLTDAPHGTDLWMPYVNQVRNEVVYQVDREIHTLDLASFADRVIYTKPEGFDGYGSNVTADGKYVITANVEDLSDRITTDQRNGYVGFREWFEAHPLSQIVKIAVDGSGSEVIHEERNWLGHLNTSPVVPNIMTFCYEGPWDGVGQRIWVLNTDTGEVYPLRPQAEGEAVGHEYWMPDGEHVGYHGRTAEGEMYGSIRYDNTDQVEAPFAYHSWHYHSYFLDMVVGDGTADNPYLLLWRLKDGKFEGPKALAWHRGSFHTQDVHVHPQFSPDGKKILYTADAQGYGQVFIVEIPDWDDLPDRATLPEKNEV